MVIKLRYFTIILLIFPTLLAHSQESTGPDKPNITYVTVDTATNNNVIYWTASKSDDVEWYRLYYQVSSGGVPIDSVSGDSRSYTHTIGNKGYQSYLYSIDAVDSSGFFSLREPGLHSPIHTKLMYDSCQNTITINWTKYIGWDNNVSGYVVYWKSGNNTFQVLDAVINDSLYIHRNIKENATYSYFVEAINFNGLISRSNISSKYTYMPSPPEELVLDLVTISAENEAEIQFHSTDTIYGFNLLRSSVPTSDFEIVHQFYNSDQNNYDRQDYILHDYLLSKSDTFYYKIGSLNTCRKVTRLSNLGVNIRLDGTNFVVDESNDVEYNKLYWNEYIGWESGVEGYQLYRLVDSDGLIDTVLIESLEPNILSYIDFLKNNVKSNLSGELSYLLKAKKMGEEVYSISNPHVMKVTSDLIMPNAFTPSEGRNNIFKPIIRFAPAKYNMIIYDRSGIPIFQSNDVEVGWDGKINDNPVPQGVYVYHIQYTSFNGSKKSETGTLTVFYPNRQAL